MKGTRAAAPAVRETTAAGTPPRTNAAIAFGAVFVLIVVTWMTYGAAAAGGYTRWDDPFYVVDNHTVDKLDAETVRTMFTTYVHGNYHPVTMLSYAADSALFGKSAESFHRTNVVLHLIAVALAFFLFRALLADDLLAFALALVFALHPMRAEPVAWIAGRKELLLGIFYIAGLLVWVRYARRPSIGAYLATLLFYVGALLSKGTAVTFPVALLAIDFLAQRRDWRRIVLEKIPLLALSLVFGVVAIKAQQAYSAMAATNIYTIGQKAGLSSYAFMFYVVRLFAPEKLSAFYPYPMRPGEPLPWIAIIAIPAALALVAIAVVAWRRNRFVTAGIAIYAITIGLVLQVVAVGGAIVADRYSYLPHLGLLLAIGGIVAISRRPAVRNTAIAIVALAGILFAFEAHARALMWGDSVKLWSDATANYPRAAMAWNMLARAHIDAGDLKTASGDIERALTEDPNTYESLVNRGIMRGMNGDFVGSLADLNHAVAVDPKRADAYYNRALTQKSLGHYDLALADLDTFEKLRPNVDAILARGDVFTAMGRQADALAQYNRVLATNPQEARALTARASIEYARGDYKPAERDLTQAIAIQPDGNRYYLRTVVRLAAGDRAGASEDAARAEAMGRKLDPQTAAALGR